MKNKAGLFIAVSAVLILVLLAVFAVADSPTEVGLVPIISSKVLVKYPVLSIPDFQSTGRPAACRYNTVCTPGNTCCWTTATGGDRQVTCPNKGLWPDMYSEVRCLQSQSCDKQGIGGKCVSGTIIIIWP